MLLNLTTQFIRFCIVGIISTLLHIIVASVMLYGFGKDLIISNLVAYLFAFGLSYLSNAIWSFNTKPTADNFQKYLASSLLILVVISSLSYLIKVNHWPNDIGVLLVALIIPILNYLLLQAFVFKHLK